MLSNNDNQVIGYVEGLRGSTLPLVMSAVRSFDRLRTNGIEGLRTNGVEGPERTESKGQSERSAGLRANGVLVLGCTVSGLHSLCINQWIPVNPFVLSLSKDRVVRQAHHERLHA